MQFGRAIGSFQAVKHRCANMLISTELARSVAYYAAAAASGDAAEFDIAAEVAAAFCAEAFVEVASQNIQVHGGIGFTWEHPAHLYVKRAKSSSFCLESPASRRAWLAEVLGIGGQARAEA
jgi:alkylation response protein AidB-like acyl-CoA dehydrogenase